MTAHNTMRLSQEEHSQLTNRFPKDVELSLGNHLSGKVHADLYEIIPVGKPAFLWLTYFQKKHAAILVFKTHKGYKFEITSASFIDELAYGTIFTGVFFTRPKTKESFYTFFCINDIQYYRGMNVNEMRDMNMYNKLSFISRVFDNKEIDNIHGIDNVLNISLPIFASDYSIAQSYLGILPYPTYGIRFIDIKDKTAKGIQPGSVKTKLEEKSIFVVRANIEPDSYTLYAKGYKPNYEKQNCYDEDVKSGDDSKYGIVFSNKYGYLKKLGFGLVPTYKDSIRMNMLFRNIKENISIDAIEESDDEDEFENIEPTKYMIPNAEYKMYCYFSTILNKWVPESLAPDTTELSPLPKFNNFNPKIKKSFINTNHMKHTNHTKIRENINSSQYQKAHSYSHKNKYNQQTNYKRQHMQNAQTKKSTYKNLTVNVNMSNDRKLRENNSAGDFINTNEMPRHNRNFNDKRLFSSPFQPINKTPEMSETRCSPINYRAFSSPSPIKQ